MHQIQAQEVLGGGEQEFAEEDTFVNRQATRAQ